MAWFILLPVFVVGGGLVLLAYAVFSEVNDSVIGGSAKKTLDSSTAREIARRMCVGQ